MQNSLILSDARLLKTIQTHRLTKVSAFQSCEALKVFHNRIYVNPIDIELNLPICTFLPSIVVSYGKNVKA